MDYITISDFHIQSKHGHFEHEHRVEQEFLISLKVGFDSKKSAESDDLEDTIDFDVLRNITVEIFKGTSHFLLETLAEEISHRILTETSAREVTISIQKTAVWPNAVPGIIITRTR